MVPGIVGQSATELVVVFNPETPDRTAAINGCGPSPLPYLRESAILLERLGASVIGYPCNTAHYFLQRATRAELPLNVPLVDMIVETAREVAERQYAVVGLLGTTGTVRSRVYQDALAARGVRCLTLDTPAAGRRTTSAPDTAATVNRLYDHFSLRARDIGPDDAVASLVEGLVSVRGEQDGLLTEAILGPFGIKAGHTRGLPVQLALEAARRLTARGAEALVLGCTELPLVLRAATLDVAGRAVPLVDPTKVLATRLRAYGGALGVAGGLGPEATVDLLEKLEAPTDFSALLHAIVRATIEDLGATCDQDHLKMLAIASPNPAGAVARLRQAGVEFLVLCDSTCHDRSVRAAAGALPVAAGVSARLTAHEAVMHAALTRPIAGVPREHTHG